jgi:hypothetical protein
VELADTQRRVHARGGQKKVDFYLRLGALGLFPADAPATIRAFGLAQGQLSIEALVGRYRLRCQPVRDLIVDYLRERQPVLDYASLDAISASLAGLFWAQIEALSPGISSLRWSPEVARTWKQNLQTKERTIINGDGNPTVVCSPSLNVKDELPRVRAFYLDIAQWAAEDPAHWAPWAVPCPIGDAEIGRAKDREHRNSCRNTSSSSPTPAAKSPRPRPTVATECCRRTERSKRTCSPSSRRSNLDRPAPATRPAAPRKARMTRADNSQHLAIFALAAA